MSSVDQEETVAECVQQGAEEYLVKPVTKKEVQHIWQHVWRKRCAAAPVPQLPLEAAAAAAVAASSIPLQQLPGAAATTQADASQPVQAAVQSAAAAALEQQQQQQQQQQHGDSVECLVCSAPHAEGFASLHQRQSVFSAAVSLVQGAHLQRRPLLCLRPTNLHFSQQHGLGVMQPSAQQQGQGGGSGAAAAEVEVLYTSPDEAAGQPTCQSDLFSLGLLFVGEWDGVWGMQRCIDGCQGARDPAVPPQGVCLASSACVCGGRCLSLAVGAPSQRA
jgi:CheY-like chemotaxis protein